MICFNSALKNLLWTFHKVWLSFVFCFNIRSCRWKCNGTVNERRLSCLNTYLLLAQPLLFILTVQSHCDSACPCIRPFCQLQIEPHVSSAWRGEVLCPQMRYKIQRERKATTP